MRKVIGLTILMLFIGTSVEATAETNVRANCSDNAKQLLDQGWDAQPMDRSPTNTGDPRNAESLYKEALQDSPQCKLALSRIAALLQRDENFRQANEYNDLLLKYYPDDRNALQLKAQLLADWKKNYQGALQLFAKLLEREGPGNGSLYYSIAATYSQMNRLDDSVKFLKLAMSISEGWGNTGNAQADKDFENLRKDRRFWALVKKQ